SGDWEAMADLISDEMLDTFAVIGKSNEIGRKLRERYTGLIDRVALYVPPQTSLLEQRWAMLAKESRRHRCSRHRVF
ncbi:MAG: hypothetical protein ACXWCP_31610, partial [Burkholderiales bacterium]